MNSGQFLDTITHYVTSTSQCLSSVFCLNAVLFPCDIAFFIQFCVYMIHTFAGRFLTPVCIVVYLHNIY